MFTRLLRPDISKYRSCFLWGPRQTGKSTMLRHLFPHALYYDLLKSEEYLRLNARPTLLRDEVLNAPEQDTPVIIDEVQRIPLLLNEVQWLIVNHSRKFILCGSSPRKLIRSGGNLLGGRAVRYELLPLIYHEVPDFNLNRALNHGLLPDHYLSDAPRPLLKAYVGDYLNEEITKEAVSRNLHVFVRFLEAAAFCSGEIINYTNIAADIGISVPTVKEYFRILTDTLIGRVVPAFQKRQGRRIFKSPKFYYFDNGIINMLLGRQQIAPGTELFGRAFEQYIFHELTAHSQYSGKGYPVAYWRLTSGSEVDFILGEHEVAVEVKGARQVHDRHLRGLSSFADEYRVRRSIVVSLDVRPRRSGKTEIMPWKYFLKKLWDGDII